MPSIFLYLICTIVSPRYYSHFQQTCYYTYAVQHYEELCLEDSTHFTYIDNIVTRSAKATHRAQGTYRQSGDTLLLTPAITTETATCMLVNQTYLFKHDTLTLLTTGGPKGTAILTSGRRGEGISMCSNPDKPVQYRTLPAALHPLSNYKTISY